MMTVSLKLKALVLLCRTRFSFTGSQTFNSRQLKSRSRWFNHHAIKSLWGRWKSSSVDRFCFVIRFHLSGPQWKLPLTLRNSVAAHILRRLGHIVTFPPRPRERWPGRPAPLMWNSSSCFSFLFTLLPRDEVNWRGQILDIISPSAPQWLPRLQRLAVVPDWLQTRCCV